MCMLGPKGLAHIAVLATDTTAIEEDREKQRKRDRECGRHADKSCISHI